MTQDTGSTTGTSSKSGETPSPPGSSGIEISTRRRWPLIVGALVAGLSTWVQLAFEPAYWVQALIWIPVATLLTIGGLRIAKAALAASEYRAKTGEWQPK